MDEMKHPWKYLLLRAKLCTRSEIYKQTEKFTDKRTLV